MTIKTIERSFAGGEIAPELAARFDLTKNQTGLETCRNAWTLPHGPVQNRAGLEYVLEVKDSTKKTRTIPFAFSASQQIDIELGAGYFRFHLNGSTLVEAAKTVTAVSAASPGVLTSAAHGYSNGDTLYLSTFVGPTRLNGRFVKAGLVAANTFAIYDLDGVTPIDTSGYPAYVSGGQAQRVYEVTNSYAEADLFDIHYTQSADVLSLTHPSYAPSELRRNSAVSWSFAAVSFAPTITAPAAPTVVATAGAGTYINHSYVTTAVAADGREESLPSAATTVANDLSVAGQYNTITPAAVVGAIRYNVYKATVNTGGVYGYIGQSDGSAFRDANVTPDMSQTAKVNETVFASAGNYPAAVGYFGGRRWFAGTTNGPQTAWGTRSGTEANMTYSVPSQDDDRVKFTLKAHEVNAIRHIMPMQSLIFLTVGGEWRIASSTSDFITTANVLPEAHAYEGANNAQPILVGGNVLYAAARGGHVRELVQNQYQTTQYNSNDVSLMAPHLFEGYDIVDIAFVKSPFKMAFFVRSDGALLSLTYLPEQQVLAWHKHNTDGYFESISVIAEQGTDYLYAVVRRTVNGRTVRYVERMRPRKFTTLADCFFVDAGVTYSGASTQTINTGLWHLEGKTVSVLVDGAVHPPVTVTGGAITLQNAGTKIQIGLPYTTQIRDLPVAAETQALGQGTRKTVNGVYLKVKDSSGIKVGPSFTNLTEFRQRTNEPYGSPPSVYSDEAHVPIKNGKWNSAGQVCIVQDQPLPLTILSLVKEVAIGG